MKIFLLLFLFSSIIIYAQYTENDRQIAATTFTRNFDKVTGKEYLTSHNDAKVIAGLLSISHSEDTAFVPAIISLPPDKFAREICFTLGQLGPCVKSTAYLKKLFNKKDSDPLINYYALVALGKTADSTSAEELVRDYVGADNKSKFNGISLSLYYFFSNGNISSEIARPVLERELNASSSRQFEAAFSLYRIGPSDGEKEILVSTLKKILTGAVISDVTEKPLHYLLACLRKLQYFPDDYNLLVRLKSLKNFQSQVEAVRASAYYNFKNREELDSYLDNLNDNNKNLSREAAVSLKNLRLNEDLKKYLNIKLGELIHSKTEIEKYTRGEMLISYLSLYTENFSDVDSNFFNDGFSSEYLYKVCGLYSDSGEALKYLVEHFTLEDVSGKLAVLESVLNFSQGKNEVKNILLSALNSDQPGLISISADGIDSSVIAVNKDSLIKIINLLVEKNLNNPDYIESLMSLGNLSGKISENYQKQVLEMLSGSNLYSIRKYVVNMKGETIRSISKNIDNFNDYWNEAFTFRQAEIVTEKGSFTISFFPGYAPLSVGNFCYLAGEGFFNELTFHRVVPGFVIQGGDPEGTGWGGPGYEIISEFSPLEYNEGVVGMASAGKDTEGSQWFITTGDYPHLNNKYTVFAEVLRGQDIVDEITQDDKILNINLIH